MRNSGIVSGPLGRTNSSHAWPILIAVVVLTVTGCGAEVAEETAVDSVDAFGGYLTRTGVTYRTMAPWVRMTEGQPEAVREEMAALHFGAAAFAISGRSWSEDRKKAELADVRQRLASAMTPGSGRTEAAWASYIDNRGPAYVAVVPADYDPFTVLSKDDLRRMGSVLVEGVSTHPMAPGEPPFPGEDWALSAGTYFRGRLFQLMRALEDMP